MPLPVSSGSLYQSSGVAKGPVRRVGVGWAKPELPREREHGVPTNDDRLLLLCGGHGVAPYGGSNAQMNPRPGGRDYPRLNERETVLSGGITMRLTTMIAYAGMLLAVSAPVMAEEPVTVQSLLNQDFTVVSTITTHVGPGLFLQKKDQLFLCFVVETQQSPTLNTLYCKPIH